MELKKHIAELSALSKKTEFAERKILEGAERRLKIVVSQLNAKKNVAITDSDAGKIYQKLALERMQLELVIASAKKNLK